ncbi:MAG: ABC transporter ATP-binding protein [Bryobacteraceae bacterium]|jgi:NitT/TauT family transport system ATP-binding protein
MRLRCSQLQVTFPTSNGAVVALRGLTFDSREGEFLTFVGPSGCGKTTLLRVIAGLLAPDAGECERIPGAGDENPRVLLVSQEHNLFPWMTASANAAFGLEMQGVARAEREARAEELLTRLGCASKERAYPSQLSMGMKQRVAVARCFLSNPAVMLMDEPFAALDCQTRMVLQQELLELWEQDRKSVVFVTHDVEEAILLSDRILVMSAGPGAVVAEYEVPAPRPRRALLEMNGELWELKQRILGALSLAGNGRYACAR